MGHMDRVRKLNKTKPHRESMLANMAVSLLQHRLIKTTDAKAKALRPVIDRLIVTGKKDTLAAKRRVAQTIRNRDMFKKFYSDIVPQFNDRTSGFTRVIKAGVRRGDGSDMSIVELLIAKPQPVVETKDKKGKKADAAAAAGAETSAKKPAKRKAAGKSK